MKSSFFIAILFGNLIKLYLQLSVNVPIVIILLSFTITIELKIKILLQKKIEKKSFLNGHFYLKERNFLYSNHFKISRHLTEKN